MQQQLPARLIEAFAQFFELHAPQPFSNTLRRITLEYIRSHLPTGFPVGFEEFINSLEDFFHLLDEAAACPELLTARPPLAASRVKC